MARTFSSHTFTSKTETSKSETKKQLGVITDSTLLTWYNALTTKPSAVLLTTLNTLMAGLVTDGNLVEMDLFHVIGGMETSEQRLKPLKTTGTDPMTAVATPIIGIEGLTGNGTSSYLNTNWIPSTNTVKHVLNSASFGIYIRTNVSDAGEDSGTTNAGLTANSFIDSRFANVYYGSVNGANGSLASVANTSSYGLFAVRRTASTAFAIFKNGSSVASAAGVSSSLPVQSFFLGARNGNGTAMTFSAKTIALVFVGSSSVTQSTLYTRIQTAMGDLGLSV